MPNDFGTFAPVFESAHGYLTLLRLSSDESPTAVRLVRQCAAADTDQSSTLSLLSDQNWRLTLVAAVAAAFLPLDNHIIDALWRRFDSGSWGAPQIAAILASIDPEFQPQARHRLEAHCPLDTSELRVLTMIERHSAAGPAGGTERSAKAASALQSILLTAIPQPEWLAAVLANPRHQKLVASDIDAGGAIAQGWGARFAQIRQQIQP